MDKMGGRRPAPGGRRSGAPSGKKKVDPFLVDKNLEIDWRDAQLMGRFVSERGKIVPRRVSGVTAKHQRKISKSIKRARQMSLLQYGGHPTGLKNLG